MNDSTPQSDAFVQIRNEEEKLDSFAQQISRELDDIKGKRSYHEVGEHPMDPEHIKLGFIKDDNLSSKVQDYSKKNLLSDVTTRLWMFFAIYYKVADLSEHYSRYVAGILEKLSHEKMTALVNLLVTEDRMAKQDAPPQEATVHDYANPNCKAEIHTRIYFAGAYDFESTPGNSILLHRGHADKTLLVRATEQSFSFQQAAKNTGDLEDKALDCRIEQIPVCIKFTKDRASYENEIRLRAQLGLGGGGSIVHDNHIIPMRCHFDATKSGKLNKKFAWDKMDERFRKLPTYTNTIETMSHISQQEFVDISSYPYAMVFPLSMHVNLFESIAHGVMDLDMPRCLSKDMGGVLKTLHDKGEF